MQRRMTCPKFSHGVSKQCPIYVGMLLLVVSKAKSDDEIPTRWAAQLLKKHSTSLVSPQCLKVVTIAQAVLFNSTHIVCNRGVS